MKDQSSSPRRSVNPRSDILRTSSHRMWAKTLNRSCWLRDSTSPRLHRQFLSRIMHCRGSQLCWVHVPEILAKNSSIRSGARCNKNLIIMRRLMLPLLSTTEVVCPTMRRQRTSQVESSCAKLTQAWRSMTEIAAIRVPWITRSALDYCHRAKLPHR